MFSFKLGWLVSKKVENHFIVNKWSILFTTLHNLFYISTKLNLMDQTSLFRSGFQNGKPIESECVERMADPKPTCGTDNFWACWSSLKGPIHAQSCCATLRVVQLVDRVLWWLTICTICYIKSELFWYFLCNTAVAQLFCIVCGEVAQHVSIGIQSLI
jgi:hypothetical protein